MLGLDFLKRIGSFLSTAWFFLTIAAVGSFTAGGTSVPLYWLGRVFPAFRRMGDTVLRFGVHLLMRIQPWVSCDIQVSLPGPSKPGILLVSNHRSHLDAFLVLSTVKGVRLFAKSSLFRVPFLGTVMRASGQIPVIRGRVDAFADAIETVRKKLREGETVYVFPEMTRCNQGLRGVQPFALAPFHAALQEKARVLPLVVIGTDRAWPKNEALLRPGQKITLKSLEPVNASECGSADELRNLVKNRIEAAYLQMELA